jgi:hypothetical protein
MTEQELKDGMARLAAIFRDANKGKPDAAREAEATAIMVAIAASTIGCLHRIADAIERGADR